MSVYFIKVGRYIKVGYSEDPERRCQNLWRSSTRYGRPWDMSLDSPRELLLSVPGDKAEEYDCHQALRDFAAGCEWFIDEPEVRSFMERAARGHMRRHVKRPAGPFEPVQHWDMLPERREELDAWIGKRGRAVRGPSLPTDEVSPREQTDRAWDNYDLLMSRRTA